MKAFYGNYACNAFDPAHGHSLETAGWTRLNGQQPTGPGCAGVNPGSVGHHDRERSLQPGTVSIPQSPPASSLYLRRPYFQIAPDQSPYSFQRAVYSPENRLPLYPAPGMDRGKRSSRPLPRMSI